MFIIFQKVSLLPALDEFAAVRIQALCDFYDETGQKRKGGDEWYFYGTKFSAHTFYTQRYIINQMLNPVIEILSVCLFLLFRNKTNKQHIEAILFRLKSIIVFTVSGISRLLIDDRYILKCAAWVIAAIIAVSMVMQMKNIMFMSIVGMFYSLFLIWLEFLSSRVIQAHTKLSHFIPRKECKIVDTQKAIVFNSNQAVRLRARRDLRDSIYYKWRVTGEEWLVLRQDLRKRAAFLPGVYEQMVCIERAHTLSHTLNNYIQLKALKSFKDNFKIWRKCGTEWIITANDTSTYLPGVNEKVVDTGFAVKLSSLQYCVVLDPVIKGEAQLGARKLVEGEKSFFLQPGEHLEKGVEDVYQLERYQSLVLKAREDFIDLSLHERVPVTRKAGDRWLLRGPRKFIPQLEVEVVSERETIANTMNEGIYVRNLKTGHVRAIVGRNYMLEYYEILWDKDLDPMTEALLSLDEGSSITNTLNNNAKRQLKRVKWKSISLYVNRDEAVQMHDYRSNNVRVLIGPAYARLDPYEQFTRLCLSGGTPKQPGVIHTLKLKLSPTSTSDLIVVETADHISLSVNLAYNWHFDYSSLSDDGLKKLFCIPDFVGRLCRTLACLIRSAVVQHTFSDFHKHFSKIIQDSVFSQNAETCSKNEFVFTENNLIVTSIDVQSMEPLDTTVAEALEASIHNSIQITARSQEASAKYEADLLEQREISYVQKLLINDKIKTERARRKLVELKVANKALLLVGQAVAKAKSLAEWDRIEGRTAVQQALFTAKALAIEHDAKLAALTTARRAQLAYMSCMNRLEVEKARAEAKLEVQRVKHIISIIGRDLLIEMACGHSQLKSRLLKALGIQSSLILDNQSWYPSVALSEGLGFPSPQCGPLTGMVTCNDNDEGFEEDN